MLDWFYDTPIVRALQEINKREIVLDNINEHRKKATRKRLKARADRKRKNKIKKRLNSK